VEDRIIEWFGLEGTLKIIWFQPPATSREDGEAGMEACGGLRECTRRQGRPPPATADQFFL